MTKFVAVVGSRSIESLPFRVDEFLLVLLRLDGRITIVSGGARGVDKAAEQWANAMGLYVEVIKPDWDGLGKSAGMIRNQQIVDTADIVVAVWDGKSRGTLDTITKTLKASKELHVFMVTV